MVDGFYPGGRELLAARLTLISRNGLVVMLGRAVALLAVEVCRGRLLLLRAGDGFGAVSYTHLDVYKRQPSRNA